MTASAGIFSLWFKRHQISTPDYIFATPQLNGIERLSLSIGADGIISLLLRYPETNNGAYSMYITSNTAAVLDTAWHHLLIGYNQINANYGDMLLDDVVVSNKGDYGFRAFNILNPLDIGICGVGTTHLSSLCLAEIYYLPTGPSYFDVTNVTYRRKFISAGKKPVYLGENGELFFGYHPSIYLSGTPDQWLTNRGYGGDFTLQDELKLCNSRPR